MRYFHLFIGLLIAAGWFFPVLSQAQQAAPAWSSAEILGIGTGQNNGVSQNFAVARGPGGSLYLGGQQDGRVTYPGLAPVTNTYGCFVGRQSATGQWQWVQSLRSLSWQHQALHLSDLKVDAPGNAYVVARFTSWYSALDSMRVGNTTYYGLSFVGKLNAAGQWQWQQSLPCTATAIVPDGTGGAFVSGSFYNQVYLGNVRLSAPNQMKGFLAHIDATGHWTRAMVVNGLAVNVNFGGGIEQLALDAAGRLLVAGLYYGDTLRLSPTVQATGRVGSTNLFVARLTPTASAWTWNWVGSASGVQGIGDLQLDRLGNAFVSGLFRDSVRFGTARLRTPPTVDGTYVAKLNATGQWRWAVKHSGKTYYSDQQPLALTPAGDVLLSGSIRGDTARFGTQLLTGPPHHPSYPWGYIARLQSSTGRWLWAMPTPRDAPGAYGLVVDSAGTQAYAVGSLFPSYGGTAFGATALPAPIAPGFVAALSLQSRQWQWANSVATGGGTRGKRTLLDTQGNLTVAGDLLGEVTFGPHTVLEPFQGTFVARRAATGAWRWVQTANGFWPESNIGQDAQGNVYLFGQLSARDDTARFGSLKLTYQQGLINTFALAKISAAGQWEWVRTMTTRTANYGKSQVLTVDAQGRVTLAGFFGDSLRIGQQVWYSTPQAGAALRNPDGFVARFNAHGVLQWFLRTTSPGEDYWLSAVPDQQGGVTVAGELSGDTVRLGNLQVVRQPGDLIPQVIAHLDSVGNWQWAVPMFGDALRGPLRLVADSAANLWVTGMMDRGSLHFGNHTVTATRYHTGTAPYAYGFVARLSPTRQWQWAGLSYQLMSVGSYDWPYRIQAPLLTLDGRGGAYLCGEIRNSVQWNNTPLLVPDSLSHSMVLRLDSAGRLQWQQLTQATAASFVRVVDMVAAPLQGLYLTGNYEGPVSFGPYALPTQRLYNGFLATLGGVNSVGLPDDAAAAATSAALWPNPAATTTRLRLPTPAVPGQNVRLYDALGRQIRELPLPGGATTVDLPLAGVPPGVYIVRSGRVARKLVVAE